MPTTAEQIFNEALSLPLEARADLTERIRAPKAMADSCNKGINPCQKKQFSNPQNLAV
jgi:hypothetical protein